ncbi:MAG: preprotein translocase subunit SecE [bacterium]|nr:preprotein translocase subunit SecE [bacterium]
MGFFQYIKDTQGELRYVAWPTRLQTIVYTILVILISIFIALYLGLFDFIFTTGLRNTIETLPQRNTAPLTITQNPIATSTPTSSPNTLDSFLPVAPTAPASAPTTP